MRVLLTGGAGYIGSHTAVALLEAGHDVAIVDDLSNSDEEAVRRIAELAPAAPSFHCLDLRDARGLDQVFSQEQPEAVIHFAGLKAVGESVAEPLRYYDTNLGSTITLLHAMERHGVRDLVFSSSATVYGDPAVVPVTEAAPVGATNPYGRTKLFIEEILRDVAATTPAGSPWRVALLRYFNPIGAHPSGRIGEDPLGIPNNLMPFVLQVAVGRLPQVRVFGDDYPTPDGTGVRDYIHVVDLAAGHLAALEHLDRIDGAVAINLGTGRGHSVLEVIAAASRAVGRDIPYEVVDRRPGDIAVTYADPSLAGDLLGWRAERTLDDMCVDSWRWQSTNPNGYAGSS